jgi:hypothetical protein
MYINRLICRLFYIGFQKNDNAPEIFAAMDIVEGNVLPFFASDATTGSEAWPNVQNALNYFTKHGDGKLIRYVTLALLNSWTKTC